MSGQPSPSASKKAAPEPNVSGRYFFPARPELCTNLMPACAVTSVKVGEGRDAENSKDSPNEAKIVAHALLRAASRLVSTPPTNRFRRENKNREPRVIDVIL